VINNPNEKDLYQIYNIGNNAPVQLMDFIKALEHSLGKEATKEYLPIQAGDVKSTYGDVSGLMNDFDYKPDTSHPGRYGKICTMV
jgi:UDP-glucuronate 4-epimerase